MSMTFVNHTNHVTENWSTTQRQASETFGVIIDVPFPVVPPDFDEAAVAELVQKNLREILKLQPAAVLCQGEFNYTFALVSEFKEKNILQIAEIADAITAYAQNFPDAIKICRTDTIEEDLENLSKQIAIFRANGSKDLESALFAKIIATVEAEYGELIDGSATRFEIIR